MVYKPEYCGILSYEGRKTAINLHFFFQYIIINTYAAGNADPHKTEKRKIRKDSR